MGAEEAAKSVTLRVLVDDSVGTSNLTISAKHGLSFLVNIELAESRTFNLLLDTGPSADIISHNIEAMDIDPGQIELIVISHGHHDHTGGLVEVLKMIGRMTPVVAHPRIFDSKFRLKPKIKMNGIPFSPSTIAEAGGVLLLAKNPSALAEGVTTTGQVERSFTLEKTEGFGTIVDGMFMDDELPDDQAVVVSIAGKGLVILAGCAHSGITNAVRYAQKIAGIDRIHAVIGGFHLFDATEERMQATLEELLSTAPQIVAPCHCTGIKMTNMLMNAFGDRCVVLRTGDTLKI